MEPYGSLPHSQQPATFPLQNQLDPVHAPTSNLLKIHPIHASPSHFLNTHFNIILPSTPWSSKWLFPSGFPSTTLYTPLLSTIRATYSAHLILLDFITRTVFGEQYSSLSSSLCSFLHSPCHLVPLRPKYSPQHPILKYPQPTFFPQCKRPGVTPMQHIRVL